MTKTGDKKPRVVWTSQAKADIAGLSSREEKRLARDLVWRFEQTSKPAPVANSSAPGRLEISQGPLTIRFTLDPYTGEFRVEEVWTHSE